MSIKTLKAPVLFVSCSSTFHLPISFLEVTASNRHFLIYRLACWRHPGCSRLYVFCDLQLSSRCTIVSVHFSRTLDIHDCAFNKIQGNSPNFHWTRLHSSLVLRKNLLISFHFIYLSSYRLFSYLLDKNLALIQLAWSISILGICYYFNLDFTDIWCKLCAYTIKLVAVICLNCCTYFSTLDNSYLI